MSQLSSNTSISVMKHVNTAPNLAEGSSLLLPAQSNRASTLRGLEGCSTANDLKRWKAAWEEKQSQSFNYQSLKHGNCSFPLQVRIDCTKKPMPRGKLPKKQRAQMGGCLVGNDSDLPRNMWFPVLRYEDTRLVIEGLWTWTPWYYELDHFTMKTKLTLGPR